MNIQIFFKENKKKSVCRAPQLEIREKIVERVGGNAQRIFIRDSRLGWNDVKNNEAKHLIKGYTLYVYIQSLRVKMEGQAHPILENCVEQWDHTQPTQCRCYASRCLGAVARAVVIVLESTGGLNDVASQHHQP